MDSKERAYYDGLHNNPRFGYTSEEQREFERGRMAAGTWRNVHTIFRQLFTFALIFIIKPAVLYSPFLLMGWATIYYPASLLEEDAFAINKITDLFSQQMLIFLLIMLIPSYLYFCGFQYLRALIIGAKNNNLKIWRLGFVICTLFITIIPMLTAITIMAVVFAPLNGWFIVFIVIFGVIVLYKAYNKYDILNPNSTPAFARWAFELGREKAAEKFSLRQIKQEADLTIPEKQDRVRAYMYILSLMLITGFFLLYQVYSFSLFYNPYSSASASGWFFSLLCIAWAVACPLLARHFALTMYDYRLSKDLKGSAVPLTIGLMILSTILYFVLLVVALAVYSHTVRDIGGPNTGILLGLLAAVPGCLTATWFAVKRVKFNTPKKQHLRNTVYPDGWKKS